MVLDETGALANMTRHDYLPFGEELFAPASGRSTAQGYSTSDGIRQHFTLHERDMETGFIFCRRDFTRHRWRASQAPTLTPDVPKTHKR